MQNYEDLFMPSFLNDKKHNDTLPIFPKDISLSMAYIPFQQTIDAYPPEKALSTGTLFEDLNKPFKGMKRGQNE